MLRRTAAALSPLTATSTHPRQASSSARWRRQHHHRERSAGRLRVSMADESLVSTSDAEFKSAGAHRCRPQGQAFQVIVGMDVPRSANASDHGEQLQTNV